MSPHLPAAGVFGIQPSMLNPHVRMAMENPGRAGMGVLSSLLMSSGMSGGPRGAFTSVAQKAMESPAAQRLAATLGFGGAGRLGAGEPGRAC